jgi:precorrin-6B methylase 1
MKRKTLYIIVFILILLSVGAIVGYRMWNRAPERIEDATAIKVSAAELVKAFNDDEAKANSLYLNKAIEVSGMVSQIEKNQDGGSMVVLDTGDPIMGVQCSMRDKEVKVASGQTITVKGFCSGGGITGVTLTDCVLK